MGRERCYDVQGRVEVYWRSVVISTPDVRRKQGLNAYIHVCTGTDR
jgi:hypothetical protein